MAVRLLNCTWPHRTHRGFQSSQAVFTKVYLKALFRKQDMMSPFFTAWHTNLLSSCVIVVGSKHSNIQTSQTPTASVYLILVQSVFCWSLLYRCCGTSCVVHKRSLDLTQLVSVRITDACCCFVGISVQTLLHLCYFPPQLHALLTLRAILPEHSGLPLQSVRQYGDLAKTAT